MKKYGIILIIITAFAAFCLFDISRHSNYSVLNIINPATFNIDLNHNGKIDENEKVCLPNIDVFSSDFHLNQTGLQNTAGITEKEALGLGYLGNKFAQDVLLNKKVKLHFTDKKSNECIYADVYVENKNFSQMLNIEGFVIKKDNKISSALLKKCEKLNLVILNHKSNKYHSIDCPFGKIASDALIIPKKDLPESAKPCKVCHIKVVKKVVSNEYIPTIITSLNIKMFLTDFTTKLKLDNDCNTPTCKDLIDEINTSTETIDIAAYGWDKNSKLNNALKNAISRGVKVRLVYDTNSKGTSYYPYTYEFAKWIINSHSDEIADNKKLTNYLMHNKFVIFDNKKVYTGSMNFSTTGLCGYNANDVFIINSTEIANLYTDEFNQMYNGKLHLLKEKSTLQNEFVYNGKHIAVYFSPQDKTITKCLIPLINNSKNYVYVPAFLITHKGMTAALIKAKQRGVDVKVIIDATNASSRSSTHGILRQNNISVKTENYAGKLHMKSIIVDDRYIVGGSMNFSYSGENLNDENTILIEDPKLAKFYKNYFLYIWRKIPDKWLKYNVRAESFNSIGSCFDGIDNDFDGKVDKDDEGCFKK